MPWKSARYLISWSQLSLLVLLLSAGLLANAIAQTAKPPASTTSSPKPEAKPKLTPTQEQGLRLLKAAEAEAGALEPAMRAAVLWQVAHGYYKVDKPRVLLTLIDAFRAATTVEDDHPELKCFLVPDECHSKTWLQVNILREMLTSPQKVEELLPQADPDVRPVLTGELISKYVRDKKLDRAQQLLLRLSDEKDFPYDAASELMLAVPSDQQRVAIFNQAMSNFQTFGEGKFGLIAPEDLGTLVIRFWRHLPPATVLEAVDQLLGQAKTESEKHDDNQISLTTKQGGVSFSPYQYRLFELIPVLQELDSSRRELIARERQCRRSTAEVSRWLALSEPALPGYSCHARRANGRFPVHDDGRFRLRRSRRPGAGPVAETGARLADPGSEGSPNRSQKGAEHCHGHPIVGTKRSWFTFPPHQYLSRVGCRRCEEGPRYRHESPRRGSQGSRSDEAARWGKALASNCRNLLEHGRPRESGKSVA